ncbi:viperin family antiviral radical SAM protein [Janthinobacterium sp. P210005]|uniref:viperin family antiviral radical SAM protein n=1 Tax=Janthinobacterium sp. P210005 TaxID=3112938 RepID=UPI002E260AAD|nr:viperin family antiviral radical SAM protein [Janthinobacterium sp. P210005]
MSLPPSMCVRELVVNWHVTEVCNYGCRYCYAKWEDGGSTQELIHDSSAVKALVEEVGRFFKPGNSNNPLWPGMRWASLRLNLAGGEPLLYAEKALDVILHARRLGLETSVISNGSRLTPALMQALAPHLAILGLSLDSSEEKTNLGIGRVDRQLRTLSMPELVDMIALGRQINPRLRLKINTVVNALNWQEDMSKLIGRLAPEKWKILRMLPKITDDLSLSDAQFDTFVRRHANLDHGVRVEDNADMTESYLMIDPYGRFFQNKPGEKGYRYSDAILDVGAARAFSQVNVSTRKFCSRYAGELGELQA